MQAQPPFFLSIVIKTHCTSNGYTKKPLSTTPMNSPNKRISRNLIFAKNMFLVSFKHVINHTNI